MSIISLLDYAIGGLAAMGAGFFSNPLDVVRTRMQLQGELMKRGSHAVHYRGVLNGLFIIAKTDGILALQKGIVPGLCYQFCFNGIRLGLYQTMDNYGYTRDEHNKPHLLRQILCAATAGGFAASFATPLYLIRTQLQSEAAYSIAVGFQHHHTGLIQAGMKIYQKYGFFGLWNGMSATVSRSMVSAVTQLPTFGQAKQYLKNKDPYFVENPISCAFVASLIGGLVMVIFITPFDVMATRITNQERDVKGRGLLYKNIFDCAVKVGSSEGFWGFYKGIRATYVRTAPHTLLMLVFWDKLKIMKESYNL